MTVLVVLPLVTLSLTFGEAMGGYGRDIGEQVRLKSGYPFYHSLEEDLERASEIIGSRATLSVLNHVLESGDGLNSSRETLEELFMDGTIDGDPQPIMAETGIDVWFESVEKISKERGYNLNLSEKKPDVEMNDPYEVSFLINYSMDLEDSGGLFRLSKERSISKPVTVEGMEDPLIMLGTGGRFSTTVQRCPFDYLTRKIAGGTGNNSWTVGDSVVVIDQEDMEDITNPGEKILFTENTDMEDEINSFAGAATSFPVDDEIHVPYVVDENLILEEVEDGTRVVVEGYEGEVWDIDNLHSAWRETCYFPGDAPDFLRRLENDLKARSEQGLNVFVRKGDLEAHGLEVKDRPNLAHIYFSEENVKKYRVKGMPESFKVSEKNLEKLGLDNALSFEDV